MKELQHLETLSQTMNALKRKGYLVDFAIKNGLIENPKSGKTYSPEEIRIEGEFRFEGMTSPADSSILLALSDPLGHKGTMVASYSANHSKDADVIRRLGK